MTKKKTGVKDELGEPLTAVTDTEALARIADRQDRLETRRAARTARLEVELRPILQELASLGLKVRSLSDFVPDRSVLEVMNDLPRTAFPVTADVARILLKWLNQVEDVDLKQMIVGALRYAREPYDARPMAECFDADREERLRFPIAEALTITEPTGITDWLVERALQRRFGSERGMLLLAVAKHLPREIGISILRRAVDDLPGFAARALGEVGELPEADLLESLPNPPNSWDRKEFQKAIKKIRKRAERDQKALTKAKGRKREH